METNNTICLAQGKEEIQKHIRNLKNHKAPGEHAIPGKLLKSMGNGLLEYVSALIKEIWEKGVIPNEWQTALINIYHSVSWCMIIIEVSLY